MYTVGYTHFNAHHIAVEEVKKKLTNIRTQYTREKTKTRKRKTGQGAAEIYTSKWQHFQRLYFLDDYVTPKSSHSNLEVKFIITFTISITTQNTN